jgi:hypothetical protein
VREGVVESDFNVHSSSTHGESSIGSDNRDGNVDVRTSNNITDDDNRIDRDNDEEEEEEVEEDRADNSSAALLRDVELVRSKSTSASTSVSSASLAHSSGTRGGLVTGSRSSNSRSSSGHNHAAGPSPARVLLLNSIRFLLLGLPG